MLQLLVSLPQSRSGVAAGPSAASALGADSGGGVGDGVPGLPFGTLLTRQIKGLSALIEGQADAAKHSIAPGEDEKHDEASAADGTAAQTLPFDLSALQASMLVLPSAPRQDAANTASVPAKRADASRVGLNFPVDGKAKTAEIADSGKDLPQAIPSNEHFSEKLAALTDGVAAKADTPAPLPDAASAVPVAVAGAADVSAALHQPESVPTQQVSPTVGSAEWGGAVGDKVVWMANQGHQVAELHLNPPNLGPLEVRLSVNNDQASALFVSHHAAVRDAIETALPRLREMLADNGIMLGNVSVGAESFTGQQQAFDRKGGGQESGNRPAAADDFVSRMVGSGPPAGSARDGMVDIFA